MSTSLNQTIELLSREKNIDPQIIVTAIEDAVESAAKRQYKSGEELKARFNEESGEVELFALMTVVEEVTDPDKEISLADVEEMGVEGAEVGDKLEFPKPPPSESLGRIAAQAAKQTLVQRVREAERNNIYDEYIQELGELVHGYVKRFEGGRIIVDLGKIEAVMPKTQQSRAENFNQGERVRVVIDSVAKDTFRARFDANEEDGHVIEKITRDSRDTRKDNRGPQVEVSRTSPQLLRKLFEMEVPEIYDGTVQMKAAVREPGNRAKIAVVSIERDVDPVGACVGMKGSRVQSIIRELRGERIDIIEWSEDPAIFAANALSPAKVSKVEINSFEDKRLTITVADDQLSLAIGKNGQNVRLAAKLIGWHIDIRSAEEAARDAAAQLEAVMSGGEASLTDIRESLALDQITTERLKERGIETIEELSQMSVDELVDIIDVSFDQATEVIERAKRLLAQKMAREVLHPPEAVTPADATEPAAEESENFSDAAEAAAETNGESPATDEDAGVAAEASDEAAETAAEESAVQPSEETENELSTQPETEESSEETTTEQAAESVSEEVETESEETPTDDAEEAKNDGQ